MKENEREMPNVEITEDKANNNKKRNLIIAGLVALVAVVGIGGYILLNQKTDELTLKKDVTYELGETVKLDAKYFLDEKMSEDAIKETKLTSTLMTDTKKYTFDKKKLTVTTKDKKYLDVGTYEISLKLNDDVKDAEFKVEDTTAPKFEDFLTEIRIEKDAENVDLKSYFKASDLSDVGISIDQGDFDITKVGDYEIKVTASDKYKNKTVKECTVKVVSTEEAKEEGLTENKEGKMAVSKETKAEIDSGKTTINKSEDKVDNSNSSSNTGNSSSGNTGNSGSSGNTGNSGSGDNKPEHKHNYVAQYETIHHPAEYETQWVVDQAAWDEQVPKYEAEYHSFCNVCGVDLTAKGIDRAQHIKEHVLAGEGGSTTEKPVWILVGYDTVHHDEVGHNEQVLVKEAWDEQKLTGYVCSECGKPK